MPQKTQHLSAVAVFILIATALLASCAPATAQALPNPDKVATLAAGTIVAEVTAIAAASPTPAAQATSTFTPIPTATPAPTSTLPSTQASTENPPTSQPPTASPAGSSGNNSTTYLDDRSTATGLILSYFNAINSKQYLRAYSYWQNAGASSQLPSFSQFEKGYADTASVKVTLGAVGGAAAAGQRYYTVPAVLKAKTTGGKTQTFEACYILHLAQPEIQGTPPFQSLGIQSTVASQVDNDASPSDLLAKACQAFGIPQTNPISPTPTTNTTDISPSNYLDDRSGPVEVLRSLFNAINRKEYLRAYSYWQNPGASSQLPPFSQFEKGYADTASVSLKTGQFTTGAGAGQLYYSVPVILKAETTAGKTQTFAGCYVLHLSRPEIQGTPPFQPLGIQSAKVKQVANNADTNTLLNQACSTTP